MKKTEWFYEDAHIRNRGTVGAVLALILLLLCGCFHKPTFQEMRLASFSETDTVDQIVFVGDSLTNLMPLDLFDAAYVNRGVGGYKTADIIRAYDKIIKGAPRKLFIMAGINDLNSSVPVDGIVGNFKMILHRVPPRTQVYIQSVLPSRDARLKDGIIELNKKLEALAEEYKVTYINLYPSFTGDTGILEKKYTATDGVHLNVQGYEVWKGVVQPYLDK